MTVEVRGFRAKKPDHVPITKVATLFTSPTTGELFILVLNQALYFGDLLKHSLLNPNQLRDAGLKVNDVPTQYDPSSSHDIVVPNPDGEALHIPLMMSGVVSHFLSQKPTWDQYDNASIPRLELTLDRIWDPKSSTFAEKEELAKAAMIAMVDQRSNFDFFDAGDWHPRAIAALTTFRNGQELIELDDEDHDGDIGLYDRLISTVNVAARDIEGDGLTGRDDEEVFPLDDHTRSIMSLATTGSSLYDMSSQYDWRDLQPDDDTGERTILSLETSKRRSVITPEALAKRWNIGLNSAKKTMNQTTQKGIRNVLVQAERRSRQRTAQVMFPTLRGTTFSDTMSSNIQSTRMNTGGQVFTNGCGFDRFYPHKRKGDAHLGLSKDISLYGAYETIVTDGAKEELLGEWQRTCHKYRIQQQVTPPYSPWWDKAEASIREIKKCDVRLLRRTNAPLRLWDYGAEWVTAIRRMTSSNMPELDGRTGYEHALGRQPDISPYAMFDWYEPVLYWTPSASFPHDKKALGRWVGVAEDCNAPLAYYILCETGAVVIRQDVWAIAEDEKLKPDFKAKLAQFDEAVKKKVGDSIKDKDLDPGLADDARLSVPPEAFVLFDAEANIAPLDPGYTPPEADDSTPEAYDQYLSAEVLLPHAGEMRKGTVRARKRDVAGNLLGTRNSNPMLDTRCYEVTFAEGEVEAYTANTIAENIYSMVDTEGRSYSVLDEIVEHRSNDDAVMKTGATPTTRHTTKGWDLNVKWKDGTTAWIPMKDLKGSNPVEVAEYAVTNKIADQPAFKWWVRNVLRRRERIIKAVKSRYWSKTHKFGIELPKTVEQALAIDARTNTDFWRKAIEKEMKNVMTAFEFRDDDKVLPGWKKIRCHMVFDIKAHDLSRKARLVAGGHMTDPPKESTYSSVVSRDSVRLAFLIAALNDIDILAADVQNAYLNAPTKEKVYFLAGLEFGLQNKDRPVYVVKALYGLKSSGARWRDHMAATIRDMGFRPCLADPDVWMKEGVKPNGDTYWQYILCYVDDVLVLSHDPKFIMDQLALKYTLKEGSVKEPDTYLGTEIRKHRIEDADDPDKTRWAMSPDLYVKRAVADVERELAQCDPPQCLTSKVTTPISTKYRPELDTTPLLDSRRASYYMSLIGILRWMCEIGRLDILMSVSMMSRYMASPREGHLEQVLQIFAFLKRHNKTSLVFDDTNPQFDESRFNDGEWGEYYGDVHEPVPPNAPELRGKAVSMTCFVDASHAGCQATRRSWTGVLIYVNRAPIMWYSKRQNTVETSTFSSEFIAAKIAVEIIEGLRYKLRMMGIEVDGPTNMFCDNESVVKNATKPESVLQKKHCAISYHRTREAQAMGMVRIAWEDTKTNLADLFTKILDGRQMNALTSRILW